MDDELQRDPDDNLNSIFTFDPFTQDDLEAGFRMDSDDLTRNNESPSKDMDDII